MQKERNQCLIMLLTYVTNYQLIMNFNTEVFQMIKKKETFQRQFQRFFDRYSYDNWFDEPNNKELIDLVGSNEKVLAIPPSKVLGKVEQKGINNLLLLPNYLQIINQTSSVYKSLTSYKLVLLAQKESWK